MSSGTYLRRKRSIADDEENLPRLRNHDPAESTQYSNSHPLPDLERQSSGIAQDGNSAPSSETSPASPPSSDRPVLPQTLPIEPFGIYKSLQPNGASFTSSEAPLISSSQRVTRNGERMVTNSDEEDDDETASSLEDLDDVIQRQKHINEMSAVLLTPPANLVNQNSSQKTRTGRSKMPSVVIQPIKNGLATDRSLQYEKSLAELKDRKRKLESSNADIAKLNAMLDARDRMEEKDEQEATSAIPNEDLLDSLLSENKDEEEVSRLKIALSRTEAFQVTGHWSFFDCRAESEKPTILHATPRVEHHILEDMMRYQRSRQQAFLSGFMGEYAFKNGLPQELLIWIIDALCFEIREDLRLAYVDTIAQAGMQTISLLSIDLISELFRRLGARAEALDVQAFVVPLAGLDETSIRIPQAALSSILDLLGKVASRLSYEARQHTIILLCRLLLDRSMLTDCGQQISVESALAILIDSDFEAGEMALSSVALASVYNSIRHATLRLQLLRGLPTSSFASAVFRQRLALAFFFADPAFLQNTALVPIVDLKLMAAHLLTPPFRIKKDTDFASFAAAIGILDIAIDSSGRSCNGISSGDTESKAEKAMRKGFNDDVDRLAEAVKSLSAQIIDTSALNIRRTEAKEALDGLHRRLIYAVRTEPPTRKRLLGDGGHELEKREMERWFNGRKPTLLDEAPRNANDIVHDPNT